MRVCFLAIICAVCLTLPATTAFCATGVFNQPERPAVPADPWHNHIQPLWQRVLQAERENPGFTAGTGNFGPIDAPTWKNLVAYAKQAEDTEKFRMVNGYFNQWRPKNDADTWNTPEYWASPREFIAQRGGDCEDYAIAKYFALRFLGIPADRLRIVVIRSLDERGAACQNLHAVLAARSGATWFILDNNARPKNNIFPHTQYKGRFVPIYSVNEDGAWMHTEASGFATDSLPVPSRPLSAFRQVCFPPENALTPRVSRPSAKRSAKKNPPKAGFSLRCDDAAL